MQLFHNSHDTAYRFPFGAAPTDSFIRLGIKINSDTKPDRVRVRLWVDDNEVFFEMNPSKPQTEEPLYFPDLTISSADDNSIMYTANIPTPETGQLMWYYFVIDVGDETIYYTNNREKLGGVGQVDTEPRDNSYQITVYDKNYKTPDWFKGKIMYQIFTDRFFGDHSDTGGTIPKKRNEYVIHKDWYEQISFNAHPYEMGPACNDFYGGNLKGIIDKLDYLKSLGVGVIYLNPIFDAYSNHKYDTADYMNVDPMFGTNETFSYLCEEAEKRGIRIILDGVFSHTGSDSVYFNKYGNYGSDTGAYRNPNSPYREWYSFTNFPNYESWWGCSNLPNVKEMTPSYLDYIIRDDDSVAKTWLKRGASGWRLDVADELPDEFIKIFRRETKKQNKDAVIIGEVWEDASNKISYDKKREYLFGDELDSVMNYPFKDNMLAFVMGNIDAEVLNARMMSIFENYPKETVHALMNIVGTHDTMRVKTLLGGLSHDCGTRKLSSSDEELATRRLKILSFIQMTYVGVPCIYYGDEVGMQGGGDPFNRGTYPWRAVDPELREWYSDLGALRNSLDCLKTGRYKALYASGDVYIYARYTSDGKDSFGKKAKESVAICGVNRSFGRKRVDLDLSVIGDFTYFAGGIKDPDIVPCRNNTLEVNLEPLSCEIYINSDEV